MRANEIEISVWNPTLQYVESLLRYGAFLLLTILFLTGRTFTDDASASVPRLVAMQNPPKVAQQILARATPENTRLVISLTNQRASLLVEDEVAIDLPISSGKRRDLTPVGDYKIAEQRPESRSNRYGDFVDRAGRVVQAGVSTKVDSAPSGTTFRIVPALSFLRLEPGDVILYAGRLPGYPATDGAVRLPRDIAPLIYQRVRVGTPVTITD